MIELRPFAGLGERNHGGMAARHHFSFDDYFDPARMHWGRLRVWNDETFAPGKGSAMHRHQDMEIITYVLEGAITHRDSLGNRRRTQAGELLVMSSGTGVAHSEYNMETGPTALFQIWVIPNDIGGAPSLASRQFPRAGGSGGFAVLASGMDEAGALPLRSDARVLGASLRAGQSADYRLGAGRKGYLVLAMGAVAINGVRVRARDGMAVDAPELLRLVAIEDSRIVLVDSALPD